MSRSAIVWGVLASILLGVCATATTMGAAVGFDPTGLFLVSAVTEISLSESFDIRAEAGFATGELAGLMLATATFLFHAPFPPVDPFIGNGGGAAVTPPPFSSGVVVEGVAGLRIIPAEPVAIFGQVRYLVRWAGDGVTTGPIYEAGIQFRF
jgi:hypothetical protein